MHHSSFQDVDESEQVIKDQQESQGNLADRLTQQKQQLIELCGTSCTLDPECVNIEDTKVRVRSKYCS